MKIDNRYLYKVIPEITFDRPSINLQLAQLLIKYMKTQKAVGLAANQVGYSKRVFVMGINNQTWCCFNPEVIAAETLPVTELEGCLSFPKDRLAVARPGTIRVKYADHSGQLIEETLTGLAARCFQHELDHLNGITMHQRQKENDNVLPKS